MSMISRISPDFIYPLGKAVVETSETISKKDYINAK